MFNGYNETPLISYEFDQDREKKGGNGSKCSFMHDPGAQTTPNSCQAEFWSGKPNFLGIPHISKCNCSGCYPPTEGLSYQGESTRHRPWLPTSFPVPFNGSGEWCKLPGYHQWENVGVANQSFTDGKAQYFHQAEGKHPFYRHYANSRLSELSQRGVITSVKDSDLSKLRQKVEGQNGTRQPVFCNPGCNFPVTSEKIIDGRNFCDSNEKYSNVDPYRHSYSVDQHMPRLPVVEPHIKAVPSNLSENRVPSTGHLNVKENAPSVDQGYNAPKKMVVSGPNSGKRAAYPSLMGKEGPALDNFLHPIAVDLKNPGIIDHRFNFHEPETQKLQLESHPEFFSGNMPDVIKRNNHTPVVDGRKECAIGPTSKYLDLGNGKNFSGMFYPKEFNGDKLTRVEPESCYQSSDDLTKNKNCLPRSTLIFNDRFLEKTQNAFSYQNNSSDYRTYPHPDYPYQGYSAQGLYDYSTVPQFQKNEMNQYGHRQQQQQLSVGGADQFMQNNSVIFNSQYQQPGNSDKIPQQFYPEKCQTTSPTFQFRVEEVTKNNYLETIRTKEINKNSKISPLRLLRKKKFVNQTVPEPMPIVITPNTVPALDVRKFWSTWAEEEEENVAPTQMVVLDCQNIDPEQAKLLHLYESDPFRAVHLQGDNIVALKNSEPTDQPAQEVKSSEQTPLVKDPVIGNVVGVIEQEETPVSGKPAQIDAAEPNNGINNQQSDVRPVIAETSSQKVLSDSSVKADHKPCKRGRSTESQESKDTIRHKKLNVEKEGKEISLLDKWTEKKFDFLKRAEESRAAERLRHEKEKKKIFERRLTFQQGAHSELKQIENSIKETKKINEKIPEPPSFLDDTSQSTLPAVSDADSPDLPTSEYRRNKFLDYSDGKVFVNSFQKENADVKDSDGHVKVIGGDTHKSVSNAEEIKKEQDIIPEPIKTPLLLGRNKLDKSESGSSSINSIILKEETGFEIEDIMKKMSKIIVQSSEVNLDDIKALPESEALIKKKKPKKSKKPERKAENEERSDKLTVENISVSKPTIKFSIQKSHDLKISFKVLNSSNKKYENSDEEIERKEVERTDNDGDGDKNTTELITLRLKSIQRDAPNSDRRQSSKRDGDLKENKRKFRRKKNSVGKNPVLKIKKSTPQEKEKEPPGPDTDYEDTLDVSRSGGDDFQVQETVDSAKIKLTFKRHKANYETGYKMNKKAVEKMAGDALDPGEFYNHRETVNKKSRKRKDCEMSEASVTSCKADQEETEINNVMSESDSGSNSIQQMPEEDLRNFELNSEEDNCELSPEKLTFPEISSDAQFMVSSSAERQNEQMCDEGKTLTYTNCNDKGKKNEESGTLRNDEDLSFDKVEVESAIEEGSREEILLDCSGSIGISTKGIDGSFGVDKSEEVNSIMFSTNEINHSENESSYNLNSDKNVEESGDIAAGTSTENDGDNNDGISKNNLEGNFLITDEEGCNRKEDNAEEKIETIVGLNSSGECEIEHSVKDVVFEDDSVEKGVNECNEQQDKENQDSEALPKDLSEINAMMICGDSEELKCAIQGEVLSSSEASNNGTSTPESLLITPVFLSPISQTFENIECKKPSEQPVEKRQSVMPDTSNNPLENVDVLLNQCDTKPERQLEDGEIVDSSDEEVENASEDILKKGLKMTITKEPIKIFSDFEKPRKITRTESLLLGNLREIEPTQESEKQRRFKAKSCPPTLTFLETPLLDVPVEDIPLPSGDPPPESRFDLVNYFKNAWIEAKEKLVEPPPPESQTSKNTTQSPFELSTFQSFYNPSKPEESQNFLSLKKFKIKFSLSKRNSFNFVKSKIEDFEEVRNRKGSHELEEKSRNLMTAIERLNVNEEIHKTDLKEEGKGNQVENACVRKEEEVKEVEKRKLIEEEEAGKELKELVVREEKKVSEVEKLDEGEEEKAKETQNLDLREEMQTGSPTLDLKIVNEETNTMEKLPRENDTKVTTERGIEEVNESHKNNSKDVQAKDIGKTVSEDFELKFMNINFLEPPEELMTEDVEFEEVDLKTVEMMDEPISVNFDNSMRKEFYECEDIPTSEDLPNGDIDMDVEKVSDDDKFRNIMQNCLENAKKFFNVGNLKLFSCSVDDLLELDCQAPDSNLNENEPDTLTNHFSRDVLLTSCEETITDDLGLSGNFQPTDMSMDFVPSFASDAPQNLCPEILPVDNWPYLEEEVPSSPNRSKPEETDLIPIETSETVCRKSDGQQEKPSSGHKNDFWSDIDKLNRDKIKRMFPNGNIDNGNFKRFRRRSLLSEAKIIRKLPSVPRRNTIESFEKNLLSYEKKNLKKEITNPKNGVDKIENFYKNNSTLKCRLSLEKLANRNRHKAAKSDEFQDDRHSGKPTEMSNKIPYHKSPSWQPKVMLSRIPKHEIKNVSEDQNCATTEEKITSKTAFEALPISKPRVLKQTLKIRNSDFCESKKIFEKHEFSESRCLDHNANEDRTKLVQACFDLLKGETENFESSNKRELDSIKQSSAHEIRKPKKSRFRNLYTKERRKHDLKKAKDSSTQSTVPKISKAVCGETVKLLKDSPKGTNNIIGKSTADVEEKTKMKSSEERSLETKRKSSISSGSPDRTHDKISTKSSLSYDKTKPNRSKEESKHKKSDGEKYQSRHEPQREKSDSKSNHKQNKHDKHRKERKETSPEGKRRLKELWRKHPEKGRSLDVEEKEKPGSGEQSPVNSWTCQVCGFNNASERIAHIKSHPFHCQSCHLAFETETYFVNHLTRKHKDIRNQHHCLLCELSFDTEKQYQRHLETREHVHLESVEKNTINTLFTLLTGRPCPVLGLVDMKPEWLPSQPGTVHFYHQATPLSLALQYLKMHPDLTSYSAVSSVHPN